MGLLEGRERFRDLCRTFCDLLLLLIRAMLCSMMFADALRVLCADMRRLGRKTVMNRVFSVATASDLFEHNILGS
jgi:hypothetical protein